MNYLIFIAWFFGSGMILSTALSFLWFYLQVKGSVLGRAAEWLFFSITFLGLTASTALMHVLSGSVSAGNILLLSLLAVSGVMGTVCSYYLRNVGLILSEHARQEKKKVNGNNVVLALAGLLVAVFLFMLLPAGVNLEGYSLLTAVMFPVVFLGILSSTRDYGKTTALAGIVLFALACANILLVASGKPVGQNIVTSTLFMLLSLTFFFKLVSCRCTRSSPVGMVEIVLLSTVMVTAALTLLGHIIGDPYLCYSWAGGGKLSVYSAIMFTLSSGMLLFFKMGPDETF